MGLSIGSAFLKVMKTTFEIMDWSCHNVKVTNQIQCNKMKLQMMARETWNNSVHTTYTDKETVNIEFKFLSTKQESVRKEKRHT